jgi:hypothetical protein
MPWLYLLWLPLAISLPTVLWPTNQHQYMVLDVTMASPPITSFEMAQTAADSCSNGTLLCTLATLTYVGFDSLDTVALEVLLFSCDDEMAQLQTFGPTYTALKMLVGAKRVGSKVSEANLSHAI